jgi:serine/threonine protein kinase
VGSVEKVADYEVVRPLGEAGYGAMYVARPPARLGLDDELVGLKVLHVSDDQAALRRATRELRAFAAVPSPYLVRLLDAGRDGTAFFYAMEYCERGSLADPASPLARDEVVAAVREAALAAHALHEAGLVHRGIKPANVLLHRDGARLADLGLVQALDPGQSMTGLGGVGTLEFVEPLLLSGHPATRASDIWSLGVTLHHALVGVGVFGALPADDPLMAVRRALSTAPTISPDLPPDLAEVVGACLAPAREDRPATAEELADRLAPA